MREPRTRHSTSFRRMLTGWNDTTDGIATESPRHREEVWLINKMPLPPPRVFLVFGQRVRKPMKRSGLNFWRVQKSAQVHVNKGCLNAKETEKCSRGPKREGSKAPIKSGPTIAKAVAGRRKDRTELTKTK